jgi:hypothetical protein
MKSFKSFIKEEYLIDEEHLLEDELLIEAAGAAADSKGKLRELEIGQHLNSGKHMHSYRAEGKTPAKMHHLHSVKAHGEDYKNSDSYKKSQNHAKEAAKHIAAHLKKYGHGEIKRTVWTSQASDHHSETGVTDPHTSADLIVTTSKSHKRSLHEAAEKTRSENKVAISVKTGSGKVNYSNPGIKSLSHLAGSDLTKHTKEHEEVVKKHLVGKGSAHDKYKALKGSDNPEDHEKAAEIKHSSVTMNSHVAHHLRQGMAKKSHEELHAAITHEVSPKTHLKHIVSRQITHAKTGAHLAHHTYDLHKHVHEYLDHFHSLHVNPQGSGGSVHVEGTHKKTGKKMKVASITVSAGGRAANTSPRGTVTLPSEDNKDVHYTDKSEHMEHK